MYVDCFRNCILTSPSESVTSCQSTVCFGEITLLLRWDWFGWWGHWWIGGLACSLFTLCSIAIVSNTTFVGSTPDLNFASIAPVWSPGVLNQPVVYTILVTISNDQDGVVDFLGSAS